MKRRAWYFSRVTTQQAIILKVQHTKQPEFVAAISNAQCIRLKYFQSVQLSTHLCKYTVRSVSHHCTLSRYYLKYSISILVHCVMHFIMNNHTNDTFLAYMYLKEVNCYICYELKISKHTTFSVGIGNYF